MNVQILHGFEKEEKVVAIWLELQLQSLDLLTLNLLKLQPLSMAHSFFD